MRRRVLVSAVIVAALASSALTAGSPADATDPAGSRAAEARLASDASTRPVLRSERGVLRFAGVPASARIDNPAVSTDAGVVAAAEAHVARYGAAFGATRPGTTLRRESVRHTVSGTDLVRFAQYVDGLPVIGGELAVGLRADRSLRSMLGDLSEAREVPEAVVDRSTAARTARTQAARSERTPAAALAVADRGQWLYDPAVAGVPSGLGPRSVWRFEVSGAAGQRRMVLVDDQVGRVIADIDLVTAADRVVCDQGNAQLSSAPACASGFARVEGGPASAIADVNAAYDLSGAVATFYQEAVGLDVTDLLGIAVGGVKKLASTVRYCETGSSCPYQNAFWNGTGMYYGDGWASADDVTGHEMTHGVIERNANLLYWGQSGALNESLADIMGEILDHRYATPGDSADDWRLGEDLVIGAIRDLSDPTVYDQPDRMTSPLYTDDVETGYGDRGGVHTNSGVGNKTAYLISQGGSFNGRSVTGIDAGDPGLTKTAVLYYDVIQSLISGSDYADLADVLDQSCQDLVASGSHGFTAADCTSVHAAGEATELRSTPTNAAQPADAPDTCPAHTQKRLLFDSESGDPAARFTGLPSVWSRGVNVGIGPNATSGTDSWFGWDLDPRDFGDPPASSLTMTAGLTLPVGQPSYLHFDHWWLFEYGFDESGTPQYYDGGTVEVDDLGDAAGPMDTSGLPWVNGPDRTLAVWSGNSNGGKVAFGGDSRGYLASRLDLSSYAGRDVKLQFTSRADLFGSFIGWYLDDITVYTCDPVIENTDRPVVSGRTTTGSTLTLDPGQWTPAGVDLAFAWLRDGQEVAGAVSSSYLLTAADVGHRISARVVASRAGLASVSATTAETPVVQGQVVAGSPRITGTTRVGRKLTANPGAWAPEGVTLTYQWIRGKRAVRGAIGQTYRLGKADRGKRISVRVTGSAPDYRPATATSARTARIT